ncbi:hypothetical protein APA_4467 [Pseudanabaena sp. lw0831]|uniref:hypothetical protein n=1 Tax=Pseudanabaena sp. lw0831 TaxID=1357935 RepID=UPI001914E6F1|nr:hypothetical protein [Pseudanabaena sp. lw0831]GBO56137.1 hypothetical protein APA_4467 [Pseudanabaena sp. lw0831]
MRTTLYTLAKEQFEDVYLNMPRDLLISEWNTMLARGINLNCEVADRIEELEPDSVKTEGDRVILSRSASRIILEMCKADCVVSEYEIQAKDTFFADLAANPPQLAEISDRIQVAWQLFNKVVDTSVIHRKHLPWWLNEAAYGSCAYTGLLNPLETQLVNESNDDLRQLLIAGLNSQSEQEDAHKLLSVIANAAITNQWVLGWEYGT